MSTLSRALVLLDRSAEAAEIELKCIECKMSHDPIVVVSMLTDAMPVLDRGGRWAEGEQYATELRDRLLDFGGGHGPLALDAQTYAAHFVSRQGRMDEAQQMFGELLRRETEARENSNVFARLQLFYGAHLARRGQFEEAEHRMQAAVEAVGDIRQGTWNWTPDDMILEFITLYRLWGKPEQTARFEQLRTEVRSRQAGSTPSAPEG